MKTQVGRMSSKTLRYKAEGLLKNKKFEKVTQQTESDILKLIHELQVHQIELELQNDELNQAKEQAELASEKYTELYDFAPTAYFILNQNAEIIELNLAGAHLIGKERSQLQKNHFCLFVSTGSKAVFNSFIEKVFESNSTEYCELTLSTIEDSNLYVYLTGIVKENEKHCFVTAVDITQHKQMELELIKAKEKAEENDQLKTAFMQNMSHEILTPMNAIKGFSELLLKNYNNETKLQKYTKIINNRCNDLLDIINDILDIAKIESGQIPVNMEECNLDFLFNELTIQFKEYQQRQDKEHITFNLQKNCDPSITVILTDKGKLKQIFINLLTNAFKFTEKGKINGGCKFENNNLIFYVSDTGIGIPAEKQNLVFERFAQLRQAENKAIGGTGLGLSIVKGLVSLMGGEMFLVSESGKGSTFSFTLPFKIMHPSRKENLVVNEPKEHNFNQFTILIVEDDISNAEYLYESLIETGIKIVLAETGSKAVNIATTQTVDLVLMDIQLPDIDGYKAAQLIKTNKPYLKIIAQTAFAADSDKKKAFNAGFNDYISKPINVDGLLSMIGKHLSYVMQK
jgi:signal transduction histidine kinase/ActR/RegA family two-component response regulator